MKKMKFIVGIVSLLLVGSLMGSLITGVYLKKRIRRIASDGIHAPARTQRLVDRLSKKLDLSEKQRLEVKTIIEESLVLVQALREKTVSEMAELNKKTLTQLEPLLDDEQKSKLDRVYSNIMKPRGKKENGQKMKNSLNEKTK